MKFTRKSLTILALATLPALALAGADHAAQGAQPDPSAGLDSHDAAGLPTVLHAARAGRPGDPTKVSHTIAVEMDDTMRFTPGEVSVKAGETVRFFVVNKGGMRHEMVIGTADEIAAHAAMMRKTPGMVHKEANQVALAPGQRSAIVWQFPVTGNVTYACLIPGHIEAGMIGTVAVN